MASIKQKMTGTVAHNIVRVMLIAHIIATSYWPTAYVKLFQHLATRIVVAVLVVALLFWDVVAGALLAILLVLTIQEAKSRSTVASVLSLGGIRAPSAVAQDQAEKLGSSGLSKLMHLPELQQDLQFLKDHAPELKRELVAAGVYGQQQIPQITNAGERVGAYMDQIGELGISKQIQAGHGVTLVDGVPSVKVNMGQLSQRVTGFLGNKEGLATDMPLDGQPTVTQQSTFPTVNLGTEYEHPANNTISENLKIKATGFITDKNLLDAQINSITGLDGAQPPCAVASAAGIWNAQGFGGIARAVDNEDCPHSFI
jgi:hypothetical protein